MYFYYCIHGCVCQLDIKENGGVVEYELDSSPAGLLSLLATGYTVFQ